MDMIPLCVPEIKGNEWKYIKDCLDTGWVSSVGVYVDRFEQALAKRVGMRYAVATASGTAALHIALLVGNIKPNDEVLVSSLTFIASVNAIRYTGAWPVFIDAEPNFWQMSSQKVLDFIEKECLWIKGELRNKITSRRIKGILPVHILGHPVDMDPILEVAKKYNLVVIEDASEGLGAKYKEQSVGHLGDIACFSFNGNKLITTGGGGMIVTNNEQWAQKAKYLTTQAKDNPIEFIHGAIGYNYRLTNIQAAMGCAQLEKLDEYIAAKRRIALTYNKAIENIPGLQSMQEAPWAFSTFWLYTILVNKTKYGMGSRKLLQKLEKHQIQTRPLWQPIHLSPAHQSPQVTNCSISERLNRDALSLPCSVGLTNNQQQYVCDILLDVASQNITS